MGQLPLSVPVSDTTWSRQPLAPAVVFAFQWILEEIQLRWSGPGRGPRWATGEGKASPWFIRLLKVRRLPPIRMCSS
ncbi:hypothetical protein STRIP9103_07998 [Streptomyces ipomoeae 91-03]|uniref:Uncharacterized protein n=1 Tax=Streptomyces ipomoeae 91-03 TaxID=698759 RepID=L1KQ08_9ACTN|nr:hypothetical protein STRIP9103_07998 [Streptomyces ipomoeae 91-03]